MKRLILLASVLATLAGCRLNLHYGNCGSDSDCEGTRTATCELMGGTGVCSASCRSDSECPGADKGKAWCVKSAEGGTFCALLCRQDQDCYESQACQMVAGQSGVCVPAESTTKLPGRDSAPTPPPKLDTGTAPPKHDAAVGPKPDTGSPPTGCVAVCASGNWVFSIPSAKGYDWVNNPVTLTATVSCSSTKASQGGGVFRWDGTSQAKSVGGDFTACGSSVPGKFWMRLRCDSNAVDAGQLSACVGRKGTDDNLTLTVLSGTIAGSTITGTLTWQGSTYKSSSAAAFTATCQ